MKKIITQSVEWMLADKLDPVSYAINQHLDRLNSITQYYEARYGYGVLPKVASEPLKEKWKAHVAKLNAAIVNRDLDSVVQLVDGCARAYEALERDALANGHTPIAQSGFMVQTIHGDVFLCGDDTQGQELMKLKTHEVLTPTMVAALYENYRKDHKKFLDGAK